MGCKQKILVVEDHTTNLQLIQDLLSFYEYDVLVARNGEEGIELATRLLPDLILMDIGLPGIDGLTATKQLKSQTETAGIPIIALTSYAMREDENRARTAGCDGYVSKPINTRTIISYIKSIIEQFPNRELGE